MPLAPLRRLARAVAYAAASTFAALAGHVLAGGDSPSLAGVAVPLVLSIAACSWLAGAAHSRWRLAAGVLTSQALFHALFSIGAGDVTLAGSGAHAHHGTIEVAAAHTGHGSHAMTAGHLVAAIATYVFIRRAEVLWLALSRGIASVAHRWLTPRVPAGPVAAARLTTAIVTASPARRRPAVTTPALRRGPPLPAH